MALTKAIDLVNPEVMQDAISAVLESQIRFAPYARLENELVGVAGDTISRPRYAYIGSADDLVEGEPMIPEKLSMTTATVTVKEAGKAVEITENAILTNVNGTLGEAESQIGLSIADKIDIDYLATLGETAFVSAVAPETVASVLGAVELFGDEDEGQYILFINPKDYNKIYAEMVQGNTFLSQDQIAELMGLQAIVKTNRTVEGEAFVQKQGAVEIVWKKTPEIKKDEDILARTVVIAGNTFYTTNLFNEGGVVKIAVA